MKLKKWFKQYLCEHTKTTIYKRQILEEDYGDIKERHSISTKIWYRCKDCKKELFLSV